MAAILLDTGVLSLMLTENPTNQILNLKTDLIDRKSIGRVVKAALTEVFFHVCQNYGKEIASAQVLSLIRRYFLDLVEVNESDIIFSGTLKCQHHTTLSYIDCLEIAYCLNNHIPFHTTEKLFQKIPHNTLEKLKIVKYSF